jgi:hypothetical protein
MTKIVKILSVSGGQSTKFFSVPPRKKVCHRHVGTLYNQAWRTAAPAVERLLRLDPATQVDSGVTRRFKRGADGHSLGKEVVCRVGGGLDTHG